MIVLGQTQFMGLKFGIFGGFGWVRSSILVDKPGFRRLGLKFGSSGFGPAEFVPFLAEHVRSLNFFEG